jgi:hypothetical protein
MHRPISDYISLNLGKDGVSPSFHGYVTQLSLHFGEGAYIGTPEELKKLVLSTYALPGELGDDGL